MNRTLLLAQTLLIAAGTAFSWTVIVMRFAAIQAHFGTIFAFGGSSLVSPVFTPCFYGGLGFIVALVWSLTLVRTFSERSARFLSHFLLFGTLFAASVLTIELCQYYRIFGGPLIACTPGVYPLAGPCAIGGSIYLASFIVSRFLLRSTRSAAV